MKPEQFLEELKNHDAIKHSIVLQLQKLVLTQNKNAVEEIKYGGLLYSEVKPYTGIFVSKNHVSMEFSNGAKFDDPNNVLKGSGKLRRHLTFSSIEDIDKKVIKNFLKQALL